MVSLSLSNWAKRVIFVSVFCPLIWILLWVAGVAFVYALSAQIVTFIVIGKLSFRFWPNGNGLSGSVHKLAPIIGWACLFSIVFSLPELWKFTEYIVMPIPAIALLVVLLRRRVVQK